MTDDDSRIVRVEVEVPGTPEQVWEAIATGPGIETWFVPAEVEPREGGEIVTHHGPYGDSRGVVTAREPPRRFAVERVDDAVLLVRSEQPAPGLVELAVHGWGGVTNVFVRGCFYGDSGPAATAREQPAWEEWLAGRFPAVALSS